MIKIMLRCMTKLLHYLKPINCLFALLNNNNNNNDNENNKMGFKKMDFSDPGPITVDLVAKNEIENKLDIPVGIKLANSFLQNQHFNT